MPYHVMYYNLVAVSSVKKLTYEKVNTQQVHVANPTEWTLKCLTGPANVLFQELTGVTAQILWVEVD